MSNSGYRTISSTETRQRWGSVMREVMEDGEPCVVESHGRPKVVVMAWDEYVEYQSMAQMVRGRRVETQMMDLDPDAPWPFDDEETMDYAVYITKINRWGRSGNASPGPDG